MSNPLYGTWRSDKKKTLAELKRHLHPGHPKLREYASRRFLLHLRYTPKYIYYRYRTETLRAPHKIIARDDHSLVTEVEPTWVNEQRLWHIHFLSETCYWVIVDLDWGFIYREFFTKIRSPNQKSCLPVAKE